MLKYAGIQDSFGASCQTPGQLVAYSAGGSGCAFDDRFRLKLVQREMNKHFSRGFNSNGKAGSVCFLLHRYQSAVWEVEKALKMWVFSFIDARRWELSLQT